MMMICRTPSVSLYVRMLMTTMIMRMKRTMMMMICRTPSVSLYVRAPAPQCPTVHSLPKLSRPIKPFYCISWRLNVSVFVFIRVFVYWCNCVFLCVCTCIYMPSLSPAILSFCILIQPPILSLCAFVCEQPGLICHISALVQQFISYFESFFLVANIWRRHY